MVAGLLARATTVPTRPTTEPNGTTTDPNRTTTVHNRTATVPNGTTTAAHDAMTNHDLASFLVVVPVGKGRGWEKVERAAQQKEAGSGESNASPRDVGGPGGRQIKSCR